MILFFIFKQISIFELIRWEQQTNDVGKSRTTTKATASDDVVVVSHDVTNYEFFYEPFYAARDDAPLHDERFIG